METFSEQETQILLNFCSNTDKPVFVLKNLPEAIKGALFSRYSRSTKSLRRLLLDEFLSSKESGLMELVGQGTGPDLAAATLKAEEFYNRVLDGFGDDSVGELGGAHVAIEDVSIVNTKILQDARVGGSPLEKSTRYVYFDQKRDGKWLYYREPAIMASPFANDYLTCMDNLFETYSRLIPSLTKYVQEAWPIDDFGFQPDKNSAPINFRLITDEKSIRRAKTAYSASVRAKVCDALRYLLPASTLTNMGFYGNGRFWQNMISRLYSSPLAESHNIGIAINSELGTEIKPFVRRAKKDDYISTREERMKSSSGVIFSFLYGGSVEAKRVTLVDHEKDALNKIVSACLYPYSNQSMTELNARALVMHSWQKKEILDSYVGDRKTRRDKPGRAFEQAYYEFDICADYGAYRDIHRHRILTQERQLLSCMHGFETPEELVQSGLDTEYSDAMVSAKDLYNRVASRMPHEAQYCVPLGYRIRWRMKMNLREAYHFCEIRSGMQGHTSYRRVAQDIYREIKRVDPVLASYMDFVDLKEYPLGRINAEINKENKLMSLGAKYYLDTSALMRASDELGPGSTPNILPGVDSIGSLLMQAEFNRCELYWSPTVKAELIGRGSKGEATIRVFENRLLMLPPAKSDVSESQSQYIRVIKNKLINNPKDFEVLNHLLLSSVRKFVTADRIFRLVEPELENLGIELILIP